MRQISMGFLAAVMIVGEVSLGMDEVPGRPMPVAVDGPAAFQSDGAQLLIRLQISEERDGKLEILSRPQLRALSGQPVSIQIGGWKAEIVAVVEPEVIALPADANFRARRRPRPDMEEGNTVPINVRLSVGETQDGLLRPRIQAQIRVWNGEPASVKVARLEVQFTASVAPKETANQADTTVDREELRLLRVLQKRISIDFDDAPLRDVIKEVAKRSEVNVVIDPRALDDQGLTAQSKVTASVRGLRLSTALDQIIGPLGLDYVVADEVIKITSRTRARGEPVTVTYPVADLVARLEQGQLVADTDAEQNLVEQIAESLSPETWDRKGGRGSIRVFQPSRSLVVRQVPDVHVEIAEFLSQLRIARKRAVVTAASEDDPCKVEKPADRPQPESTLNSPD